MISASNLETDANNIVNSMQQSVIVEDGISVEVKYEVYAKTEDFELDANYKITNNSGKNIAFLIIYDSVTESKHTVEHIDKGQSRYVRFEEADIRQPIEEDSIKTLYDIHIEDVVYTGN